MTTERNASNGKQGHGAAAVGPESGGVPVGRGDDARACLSRADSAGALVGVRIGHAKVMPPHDDDGAVAELVAAARVHGFPVAIHATDIDTLQAALDAIEAHPPRAVENQSPMHGVRATDQRELDRDTTQLVELGYTASDRIEHCALALPEQQDRIARLGLKVVTQPSFVTRRARKYRDQLSSVEQEWLWPLASLLQRGIEVSFSSDAPTTPSDPHEWIAAATRRELAPAERVSVATATRLCQAPFDPSAANSACKAPQPPAHRHSRRI